MMLQGKLTGKSKDMGKSSLKITQIVQTLVNITHVATFVQRSISYNMTYFVNFEINTN